MAEITTTIPGGKTPESGAPTVANPAAKGPNPTLPAGNAASVEAPKRGGLRGGRPRDDGLIPGSPEAAAADKKKDSERNGAKYHARKAALGAPAPALPSKTMSDQNPAGQANLPGLGEVQLEVDPFLPWSGSDIEPSVQESLKFLEEADIGYIEGQLEEARITGASAKEIIDDAAWPDSPKKGISKYGGSALAKGLNAMGVSAKHKDVILILPSLAFLVSNRVKVHNALQKLIAATKAPTEKPGEKKP